MGRLQLCMIILLAYENMKCRSTNENNGERGREKEKENGGACNCDVQQSMADVAPQRPPPAPLLSPYCFPARDPSAGVSCDGRAGSRRQVPVPKMGERRELVGCEGEPRSTGEIKGPGAPPGFIPEELSKGQPPFVPLPSRGPSLMSGAQGGFSALGMPLSLSCEQVVLDLPCVVAVVCF